MPLVKCPDCKKNVSSRASQCPFCGCPSEFFESMNLPKTENADKEVNSMPVSFEKKNESEQESKVGIIPDNAVPHMVYSNKCENGSLKFCNQCGAELEEDSEFCNQCGAKVSEVNLDQSYSAEPIQADDTKKDVPSISENEHIKAKSSDHEIERAQFCNKCGSQIDADAIFCNQCGASVVATESEQMKISADDNIGANEPSMYEEEQIKTTNSDHVTEKAQYCNQCGAPIDADAIFCNQCGAQIVYMVFDEVEKEPTRVDNDIHKEDARIFRDNETSSTSNSF